MITDSEISSLKLFGDTCKEDARRESASVIEEILKDFSHDGATDSDQDAQKQKKEPTSLLGSKKDREIDSTRWMSNSIADVRSEADNVDGMDLYETWTGKAKQTSRGRMDPNEVPGKRSAKRHQTTLEGHEDVEPAKKMHVDISLNEASTDSVSDAMTRVEQTRVSTNSSNSFWMTRWKQVVSQNESNSEPTKQESSVVSPSQMLRDYKRNLARNLNLVNVDEFEIEKLKQRLKESSELAALRTSKVHSGNGSQLKSAHESAREDARGNARTMFGGLPLQAPLESRIHARTGTSAAEVRDVYRHLLSDAVNSEKRQTNRYSSPPSFPATDLSSARQSLHGLPASPAFHVDDVHLENLSLQQSRNAPPSSLTVHELNRDKSASCTHLSQLNFMLTSKPSFASPPIQKNTPSTSFFPYENHLVKEPLNSITLNPSTVGSSLYTNVPSVNSIPNQPLLSHQYPKYFEPYRSSPNICASLYPTGDYQRRHEPLQASTRQPPSYESNSAVSDGDESSSSSLYSEPSEDALQINFSNQPLPALTPLTPVTRKPRVTHPGCTTIKYNRKSNPDLEKRRTYFCDHPGNLLSHRRSHCGILKGLSISVCLVTCTYE